MNPLVGMNLEASTDRESKHANTSLEKEKMQSHESFHPNDGNQYYELPLTGSAHTRFTVKAVDRVLYSQSVKKSPGPDKLSFGAKWLLWKWDKERIVRLTRLAIRTGRNPAEWKRASDMVIRMPGNDD